jgi:hypothetical protein
MFTGLWVIGGIIVGYWLVAGWVCGANDAGTPAWAGRTRGARILQSLPTYKLAYWLYESPAAR